VSAAEVKKAGPLYFVSEDELNNFAQR